MNSKAETDVHPSPEETWRLNTEPFIFQGACMHMSLSGDQKTSWVSCQEQPLPAFR